MNGILLKISRRWEIVPNHLEGYNLGNNFPKGKNLQYKPISFNLNYILNCTIENMHSLLELHSLH